MEFRSRSVALARCGTYDARLLAETINEVWRAAGAPASLRSVQILLKPNLISARAGPLACTDGRFILAVADWLLDQGARVTVGDSPAFGTAQSVLRKIGCLDELRRRGVRISDFNTVTDVTLSSGVGAKLAADALDCDLLVNLPKVKAHAQVRVTLAVKNYFGCVAGMRKALWHMIHGGRAGKFESLIAALPVVLPDGMTLIDGILAMHGTGPILGEPYALGITACSSNPVAADRAMLEIIGVKPQASPVMRVCAEAGLGGCRLDELSFPLLPPGELRASGFRVPEDLSPIRFDPLRFLQGGCRRILLRTGWLR